MGTINKAVSAVAKNKTISQLAKNAWSKFVAPAENTAGKFISGTPSSRVASNIDSELINSLTEEQKMNAINAKMSAIKATNGRYMIGESDFSNKIAENINSVDNINRTKWDLVKGATSEVMTNSMLSVKSPFLSTIGSLGVPVMDEVSRSVGKTISKAYSSITGSPTSKFGSSTQGLTQFVTDYMSGAEQAFSQAWNVIKTGEYQFNKNAVSKLGYSKASSIQEAIDSIEDNNVKKIMRYVGIGVTSPLRLTMASDEFVTRFVNAGVSKRLLRETGSNILKKSGADLDNFIKEGFDAISFAPENELSPFLKQIKNESKIEASRVNFTQKVDLDGNTGITGYLDNVYSDVMNVVRKNPNTLGMLAKFLKAPYNATKWTANYCPALQAIDANFWRKLSNEETRDLALGQFAVGTALWSTGYYLYSLGDTIPNGDTKKERINAISAGLQEGSINGIPINRNISWIQPLLLGSRMHQLLNQYDLHDDDIMNIVKAITYSSMSLFKDANGARDLVTFVDNLSNDPESSLNQLTSLMTNLIPLGNTSKGFNDLCMEQREANDLFDQIRLKLPGATEYSSVPILNNTVDYRRDLFGRTVLEAKKGNNEAFRRALVEDNLDLDDSPRTLSGSSGIIDLRSYIGSTKESLYAELKQIKGSIRIGGLTCSEAINKAINSPEYKKLSNKNILGNDSSSPREDFLQTILNEYNTQATNILRSKYSQLGGATVQIKRQQKEAKAGYSQSSVKQNVKDSLNSLSKI